MRSAQQRLLPVYEQFDVNDHEHIDEYKLRIALAILENAELSRIRQVNIANLDRWERNGTWVSAFDEWRELLSQGTDADVLDAMTSRSERANRLRQSAPYSGILDESTRIQLWRDRRVKAQQAMCQDAGKSSQ